MPVNFIGPIPPAEFVKEFMKCDDVGPAPQVDFTNVPFHGIEGDMYTPFVSVRPPWSNTHICILFSVRYNYQLWYMSRIHSGGHTK